MAHIIAFNQTFVNAEIRSSYKLLLFIEVVETIFGILTLTPPFQVEFCCKKRQSWSSQLVD